MWPQVNRYAARFAGGRAEALAPKLWRYYAQRYTLFSRFDSGVDLDSAMWYSVTPEPVALAQAEHVARCGRSRGGLLLDGFCGAGGNAIQLALRAAKTRACLVLAVDVRRKRLRATRTNAEIYGAGHRLDFVLADFRSSPRLLRPGAVNGVFLSPPWANKGVLPGEGERPFSVRRLAGGLDSAELLRGARALSPDVALFLPRETPLREVRALVAVARSDVLLQEHVRSVNGRDAHRPTVPTPPKPRTRHAPCRGKRRNAIATEAQLSIQAPEARVRKNMSQANNKPIIST